MELDAVADELYALPLSDFVAARNARAKQAKSEGDADLAKAITGLGKPSAAAWLANQLVRARPAEVHALVEVGAQLREATASLSGDQLRALGKQQRQLVTALVAQARTLSGSDGPRVGPETARTLQDTLHAALADAAAAEELLAARLTQPLRRSGFELGGEADADLGDGPARPAPRASTRAGRPALRLVSDETPRAVKRAGPTKRAQPTEQDKQTERDKQAEEAEQERRASQQRRAADRVATAQRRADVAASERDEAQAELTAAQQAQAAATEQVRRLRAELERAVQDQAAIENAERRGRAALDKAERRHRQAARDLAQATDQSARLEQ